MQIIRERWKQSCIGAITIICFGYLAIANTFNPDFTYNFKSENKNSSSTIFGYFNSFVSTTIDDTFNMTNATANSSSFSSTLTSPKTTMTTTTTTTTTTKMTTATMKTTTTPPPPPTTTTRATTTIKLTEAQICQNTKETTYSKDEWNVMLCKKHRDSTRCPEKEITVITGFINIGKFSKGGTRSASSYKNWMTAFKYITNDVIAYFDDKNVLEEFRKITNNRSNIHYTYLGRSTLWSFGLLDKISTVLKQKGYPRHAPNTVNPKYPCAMHAKFDCLDHALKHNLSKQHLMWVDIGYFRGISQQHGGEFGLYVPTGFDASAVAYTQMWRINTKTTRKTIIYSNLVSVAGGAFLATRDVMTKFISQYKRFVDIFLSEKLMSTDQQIVYGMYVDSSKEYKPEINIRPYSYLKNFHGDPWFKLGHLCRVTWMRLNCLDS